MRQPFVFEQRELQTIVPSPDGSFAICNVEAPCPSLGSLGAG